MYGMLLPGASKHAQGRGCSNSHAAGIHRHSAGELIMNNSYDEFFLDQFLSKILIRCFLYAFILLLFWFFLFLIGDDWAFSIHSGIIGISKHEFDLMNYFGMAFLKISAIIFFLFPYISIRMVLNKNMPQRLDEN